LPKLRNTSTPRQSSSGDGGGGGGGGETPSLRRKNSINTGINQQEVCWEEQEQEEEAEKEKGAQGMSLLA